MTAQQLKNSILQMAVQGKLVPQDPNDEPASVLLERIKAEKQELIKQGRIPKDKKASDIFRGSSRNLPYAFCEQIGKEIWDISDEVPFEIPEGWEWCRLGNVCKLIDGEKIIGKIFNNLDARYMRGKGEAAVLDKGKYVEKGTRLILVDGENSGEVFIAPENGYMGSTFKILWIAESIFANYILLFIDFHQITLKNSKKGAAIPHLNKDLFFNLYLPLPPLSEQHRIVSKIEELLPYIDQYEKAETHLTALNESFPEMLKKSILQEAVQGKLVPQDPNDEPASVLLERIKAEKQRLIKEGKIKKDKHEATEITFDKIPYEIPESWEIVCLNDIGIYRKGPFGSSLTKSMFVSKGIDTVKVYEQKNAIKKDHTLGDYYITRKYYDEKMKSFTVSPGDIIVSCAGTIGETYIMPNDIELGIINQALMRMTIFAPIDIDYFLIYFDYVLKNFAKENSKGSAIKNIPPFEIFKQLLFPLPPLVEQKRIVAKIEELMQYCDKL